MTEEHDPLLQALFAESQAVTTDDRFTENVMTKTYALRQKLIATGAVVSVLLIIYTVLFGAPLQDFAIFIAQFLSTNIINIGESWFALIIAPLNSYAGLLALLFKGLLAIQKKLRLVSL